MIDEKHNAKIKIYPDVYIQEDIDIDEKPYYIQSLLIKEDIYDYKYHNKWPQSEYKGYGQENEFFFDDCNIYQYITFPITIINNEES